MKSLYVTSVEHFSGKTAVCLGLGKRLQADGYRVGYIKPLSLQPWQVEGHTADEDAGFVKEILGLEAPAWELSPVVLTPELLRQHLLGNADINLMDQVKAAIERASVNKDLLLLEGGGSLREGYIAGLPTPAVAAAVSSNVLAIVKYLDDVRVLDDALATQARLGESLTGILINRVPMHADGFVTNTVVPYLENHAIPVFGVLPDSHSLSALTVGEIVDVLTAEVLTKYYRPQATVENLTVGAMTAEAALSRFRKYSRKAVITGGDRTDIQLAALETSTTCLILTGNLHPSPLVLKQAEEFGVTVILVRSNTMETIEKIEGIYGKTRLGQTNKLREFQNLMDEHLNYERLYKMIGLR